MQYNKSIIFIFYFNASLSGKQLKFQDILNFFKLYIVKYYALLFDVRLTTNDIISQKLNDMEMS